MSFILAYWDIYHSSWPVAHSNCLINIFKITMIKIKWTDIVGTLDSDVASPTSEFSHFVYAWLLVFLTEPGFLHTSGEIFPSSYTCTFFQLCYSRDRIPFPPVPNGKILGKNHKQSRWSYAHPFAKGEQDTVFTV